MMPLVQTWQLPSNGRSFRMSSCPDVHAGSHLSRSGSAPRVHSCNGVPVRSLSSTFGPVGLGGPLRSNSNALPAPQLPGAMARSQSDWSRSSFVFSADWSPPSQTVEDAKNSIASVKGADEMQQSDSSHNSSGFSPGHLPTLTEAPHQVTEATRVEDVPPATISVCNDVLPPPASPPKCHDEAESDALFNSDSPPADGDGAAADMDDFGSEPEPAPNGIESVSGALARMLSDVAVQASGLFPSWYGSCHSMGSGATTQHEILREFDADNEHFASSPPKRKRRVETTTVKPEVLFPTRTRPLAVFDDYEFKGPIQGATGAFGHVEVVEHRLSKQRRACKVVDLSRLNSEKRHLIETEVELLKSLVHPNIVELHAVYPDAPKVYIICEYCQGGDLASRITYHRETLHQPMQENLVVYVMQQIFSATQFCHLRGIVHRDLKPQNILFQTRSSTSLVRIIDFGLADFVSKIQHTAKEVPRLAESDALCVQGNGGDWLARVPDLCFFDAGWVRKLSKRHVMQEAGTWPYMAPEVFDGWYDHRFDNFSIGIILYELIYSRHPFYTPDVDDKQSVKARIRSEVPEFPADVSSFGARHLCKGLLEKDPEERLTATQALQHPWLSKDPEKPSAFGNKELLTMSKLNGLINYAGYDKFKRAVYLMLAQELSEQQTQELRKSFMALDVSGNGFLSPEELLEGMRHVGLDLPEEELTKLVAALSPSGSKQIQYREFVSALIQRRVTVDRAQLLECFRKIDTGGTGRISFEDVKNALCDSEAGTPGMTESEWVEVVSQSNTSEATCKSAAELSFEDFVQLLDLSMDQQSSAAAAA